MGRFASCPGRVSGPAEEVFVGVIDEACRRQVVVGELESVGVRIVDGGGEIEGGSRTAPTVGRGGGVQQTKKNIKMKKEKSTKLKD